MNSHTENSSMNLSDFLLPCDKYLGQWKAKWDLLQCLNYWSGQCEKFMAQNSSTFPMHNVLICFHPRSTLPASSFLIARDPMSHYARGLTQWGAQLPKIYPLACWATRVGQRGDILFLREHCQNHHSRSLASHHFHLYWYDNTSMCCGQPTFR